jgi:type II secretory pathway pseudopilin PulG
MHRRRDSNGYALIEALIAVALMVVLGMAVAPPLIQDLRQGKVARAESEAQIIARALCDFHRDVGHWPVGDGSEPWIHLVGNASVGGGNAAVPTGVATAQAGPSTGQLAMGTMTAHLIRNRTRDGEALYKCSSHPHLEPGWNGPYLEEVPLDPWGRSYIVSVIGGESTTASPDSTALAPATATTAVRADRDPAVVLIVSAGPDGKLQTRLDELPDADGPDGDDVVLVVESPHQPRI